MGRARVRFQATGMALAQRGVANLPPSPADDKGKREGGDANHPGGLTPVSDGAVLFARSLASLLSVAARPRRGRGGGRQAACHKSWVKADMTTAETKADVAPQVKPRTKAEALRTDLKMVE